MLKDRSDYRRRHAVKDIGNEKHDALIQMEAGKRRVLRRKQRNKEQNPEIRKNRKALVLPDIRLGKLSGGVLGFGYFGDRVVYSVGCVIVRALILRTRRTEACLLLRLFLLCSLSLSRRIGRSAAGGAEFYSFGKLGSAF